MTPQKNLIIEGMPRVGPPFAMRISMAFAERSESLFGQSQEKDCRANREA